MRGALIHNYVFDAACCFASGTGLLGPPRQGIQISGCCRKRPLARLSHAAAYLDQPAGPLRRERIQAPFAPGRRPFMVDGKDALVDELVQQSHVDGNLVRRDQCSDGLHRGVEYLLKNQLEEGSWKDQSWTGTGFPTVFYLRYHLYASYFPLLALGMSAQRYFRD